MEAPMDLKPCPKCGGDPLFTEEEDFLDGEKTYGYACHPCKLNTSPLVRATTRENAAIAWNRLEDPGEQPAK
jgi:hypothetical protein